MKNTFINRREMLKTSSAALLAPALFSPQAATSEKPKESSAKDGKKIIGIQVGAVSFLDEGVDQVLDPFQERAGINALFLAVFTYGRGIAGRQVPGQPLPDHGKQEYDTDFHGGNYATPHPQFYQDTVLKNLKAPDHGDLDILSLVLPKAKERGMKVYCWAEDVWRNDLPGIEQVQEVDFHGNRRGTLCLRNPHYRNFLEGLMKDYTASYAIDGLMWGSERQGPLNDALGARHGGESDPGKAGCFCQFCREVAKTRGISVERAIEGFSALEAFVQASRSGTRPRDGYFVEFWRLLVSYPELLGWEKVWSDGQHDSYRLIHDAAKSVREEIQVGFHIWHANSFSPFWRAEQDYSKLADSADFFKSVVYNNCGGPRFGEYIGNVHKTLFGDLSPEQALTFHQAILHYDEKGSIDELAKNGLSPDYVYRETLRAKQGVGDKALIYPGLDVDIPTDEGDKKTTPEDVRQEVMAAFRAGADGIILSRKYSEMRLANLSGAGEGLREAGWI
jgi:hypothetical protein